MPERNMVRDDTRIIYGVMSTSDRFECEYLLMLNKDITKHESTQMCAHNSEKGIP